RSRTRWRRRAGSRSAVTAPCRARRPRSTAADGSAAGRRPRPPRPPAGALTGARRGRRRRQRRVRRRGGPGGGGAPGSPTEVTPPQTEEEDRTDRQEQSDVAHEGRPDADLGSLDLEIAVGRRDGESHRERSGAAGLDPEAHGQAARWNVQNALVAVGKDQLVA